MLFTLKDDLKRKINYTTTEKELPSIAETLKESQNRLLGHKIEVFTYHKNLAYETIESASQRIQIWRSLIQEFRATLIYITVETNIVADNFIRLPMVHHDHKLADKTLEENTCQLLCLDLLFISDNTV